MIESVGQASKNSGTARTRHGNIISQECRADHFRRRPTEDIERQKSERREEEHIEPVVEHRIPKRTQLAKVICIRVVDITRRILSSTGPTPPVPTAQVARPGDLAGVTGFS